MTTGQQRPGLATAPTAPPAIPHELPADIPEFTGHEAKLERLLAALMPAGNAAETLWQLGLIRDALGERQEARSCWPDAQAIFKRLGVPITDRRFRSVWV